MAASLARPMTSRKVKSRCYDHVCIQSCLLLLIVPTHCHLHMTPCSMHYQLLFKDYENIPDLARSDQRPSAASMKPQQSALTDAPGFASAE